MALRLNGFNVADIQRLAVALSVEQAKRTRAAVERVLRGWPEQQTILDAIAAMGFVPAYKRRTHAALGIRPGHSLLDVGCGTGDDALELARLAGPGGRAVGIDRSETVIAEARRRARRADLPAAFAVGDACALAFAAHLPWNLVLLVGVWRSAGRPGVDRDAAFLARAVMLGWVVALSVL